MKILIAEDEKAMSDALGMVLRHFGYEVDTVPDGLAAVEKVQESAYDCMVFDVMMPRMDGVEALKRIRSSGDVTPVILLTAKAEVDDRITGLDAGADDYLTKPFAMGELMARIRSMTRRAGAFTPGRLSVGHVTLDVEEQEISCESSIRLSSKEAKLMKYFMQIRARPSLARRSCAMCGRMSPQRTWKRCRCTWPISGKRSRRSAGTRRSPAARRAPLR